MMRKKYSYDVRVAEGTNARCYEMRVSIDSCVKHVRTAEREEREKESARHVSEGGAGAAQQPSPPSPMSRERRMGDASAGGDRRVGIAQPHTQQTSPACASPVCNARGLRRRAPVRYDCRLCLHSTCTECMRRGVLICAPHVAAGHEEMRCAAAHVDAAGALLLVALLRCARDALLMKR